MEKEKFSLGDFKISIDNTRVPPELVMDEDLYNSLPEDKKALIKNSLGPFTFRTEKKIQ